MHHPPTTEPKTKSATKQPGAFFGGSGSTPFFQPKMTVNQPGDPYEQEADRVADQVMRMREGDKPAVQRMSVPSVQRACAHCEEKRKEEERVQRAALPSIQRTDTSADAGGQSAPSIVSDVLSSGGGQSMDDHTQQFMSSRMGMDFSNVRIHTGDRAAESASAIQARAYTSGNNVVFGKGEYQPGTDEGKRLLAHELVHVGQQGGVQRMVQRVNRPGCRNDRLTRTQYRTGLQWLRETGRITTDTETRMAGNVPDSRRERCSIINRLAGGPSRPSPRATTSARTATAASASSRANHTVDYPRLFADRRLDLVIGMGFDENGFNPVWLREIQAWATQWGFRRIVNASNPGIELYTLTRRMTYSLQDGNQQTQDITISFSVITPGIGASQAFLRALNDADITAYVGHARGGVGPDFDHINNASENVVLGDRARGHRTGTFRRPTSYRHHVTYGQQNQIEQMTQRQQWHTDRYRVWFFNACTTMNYRDELRGGILPAEMRRQNLDLILTRHENPLMTEMSSTLIFLDGILRGVSIENITTQMNEHTFNATGGRSSSDWRDMQSMYTHDGFEDNPSSSATP